ncbi:MAG: serine/threonine-protein kinase [Myxococcota bacterium]
MDDDTQPLEIYEIRVGSVIDDRYEVSSLIARGAMGKVFLATQHPLGRQVAIKVLAVREPSSDQTGAFDARFLREASMMARLNHPATVRIFDFGVFKGRKYLVMEYVAGQTLREHLRDGPMAPKRVVSFALQIGRSLIEAHEKGVIHRDLKPSNLLVHTTEEGESIKVVDFGLAKTMDSDTEVTKTGVILGTPMYMAPEVVKGHDGDGRADLYALGVVMFRALTGMAPFPKGTTAQVLAAQLSRDPMTLDEALPDHNLPPALCWVVATCLKKDPDQRFASARQLVHALRACRRILDGNAPWRAAMSLDMGHVVLPFEMGESSGSTQAHALPPPTEAETTTAVYLEPVPSGSRWVLWALLGMFAVLSVGFAVSIALGLDAPPPDTTPVTRTVTPAPPAPANNRVVVPPLKRKPAEDAPDNTKD